MCHLALIRTILMYLKREVLTIFIWLAPIENFTKKQNISTTHTSLPDTVAPHYDIHTQTTNTMY